MQVRFLGRFGGNPEVPGVHWGVFAPHLIGDRQLPTIGGETSLVRQMTSILLPSMARPCRWCGELVASRKMAAREAVRGRLFPIRRLFFLFGVSGRLGLDLYVRKVVENS